MKYLWIVVTCLTVIFASAQAWDAPLPTTREDIAQWFEWGIKEKATHMLVVYDRFSYEDFPDFVHKGESVQAKIAYWNSQDLSWVMEVYNLRMDMNAQLDEQRAWHP